MNTTTHYNTTLQNFNSIHEITEYIGKTPKNTEFHGSMRSEDYGGSWAGTESLPEAIELMTTGYEVDIEPIAPHNPTRSSQRQTPSPYGAYASVPRYLTGQPNSMIAYKSTSAKVKVVSLYKDIVFNHTYTTTCTNYSKTCPSPTF